MREFIVHIDDNGKVLNEKAVNAEFEKLTSGKWLFKITSIKKRSLSQNAYWWGCLVPLFRKGLVDAGWDEIRTDKQAHEWLKEELLKTVYFNKRTGEVKYISGSTADKTTIEFNELIDGAIKLASEYLSIQIPYPNEPIPMFDSPLICKYDNEISSTIITDDL